mgnify:CR=1 FL=1
MPNQQIDVFLENILVMLHLQIIPNPENQELIVNQDVIIIVIKDHEMAPIQFGCWGIRAVADSAH